ncbi:hypothetical protein PHYPSEUDO_005450 [Phytophthora pseudosyringae]|uniref:Uncharacterized protein n=1 Tax=Phytophthora pseudosyringae TaxID=221518 RepID=A0A8T1VPD7_9STRA|nr:hypothetical protein PHYPSEUDO_005450 [Phytophthora pseudosyringae]
MRSSDSSSREREHVDSGTRYKKRRDGLLAKRVTVPHHQVQDPQNHLAQLRQEAKILRASHEIELCCTEKPQCPTLSNAGALKLAAAPANGNASVATSAKDAVIKAGVSAAEKRIAVQQPLSPNAKIHGCYLRVKDNPEKRRLTAKYDYLNTQIMANETAIDDILAYVKAIKEVDVASPAEHQS